MITRHKGSPSYASATSEKNGHLNCTAAKAYLVTLVTAVLCVAFSTC